MPPFLLKCKIHSACLKAILTQVGRAASQGLSLEGRRGWEPWCHSRFPTPQSPCRGLGHPLSRAVCSPQVGSPLTRATEALQKKLHGVNNQAPPPAEKP